MLVALQLAHNWNGNIRILSVAEKEEEPVMIKYAIKKMVDRARIPSSTEIITFKGDYKENILNAPRADLNIFGTPKDLNCEKFHEISELTESSCLFIKDSGEESIFV